MSPNLFYFLSPLRLSPFPNAQVAQCAECLSATRESASSNTGVDILLFFLFSSFFFPLRNHFRKTAFVFPFLVSKKLSGALNHMFQSIDFELTRSGRFVKVIESLRKNHSIFLTIYEKNRYAFHLYLSKIINLTRCK